MQSVDVLKFCLALSDFWFFVIVGFQCRAI